MSSLAVRTSLHFFTVQQSRDVKNEFSLTRFYLMIKNNIVFLNEYYASEILIPPIFDVKNVVLGIQNYFPFIQMNFT